MVLAAPLAIPLARSVRVRPDVVRSGRRHAGAPILSTTTSWLFSRISLGVPLSPRCRRAPRGAACPPGGLLHQSGGQEGDRCSRDRLGRRSGYGPDPRNGDGRQLCCSSALTLAGALSRTPNQQRSRRGSRSLAGTRALRHERTLRASRRRRRALPTPRSRRNASTPQADPVSAYGKLPAEEVVVGGAEPDDADVSTGSDIDA